MQLAHRLVYETMVGPIPAGMQLDHRCFEHACVRPSHMQPVTQQKNRENLTGAYACNRSGVRGVTWNNREAAWSVRVRVHGRLHHGGYFQEIPDAERAAIALRMELMTNNLIDRRTAA